MKTYVTMIPDDDDIKYFKPLDENPFAEKLGAVLTFIGVMMRDEIPTRLVITNMRRERPEFRQASEMD